jgi:DNA-binding response OmpR family regulator
MAQRLLLADDSITIQKVIELTFADEKIDVVAVGDGEQAIARLVSEPFDIVLADVGMPLKDGFDVAAFVKGHPTLRHVPVILLTGAFESVDEAKVSAVGAAAVLAKPFEPQVLVSRVRDLLKAAKAAAPSPAAAPSSDATSPRPVAPHPAATEGASSSVDEYFERLDRAFATLNVPLEPREIVRSFPRPVPPPDTDTGRGADQPPAEATAVRRPASAQGYGGPPKPCEGGSLGEGGSFAAKPEAPLPQEARIEPAGTEASDVAPPSGLAQKFATMLAVEQGELPASALEPPVAGNDDAVIDRIVRRVVEQMSDRAVRDLASEIVSRTAERLVREEIDRIKSGA